jgi:anaerobic magnesium-protoporphyrin IX monomethyl ester cyclase
VKILFIYSFESPFSVEKPLGSPMYIQFGISYLSSSLKQSNHDINLLILSRSFGNKNYNILRKKIENFRPKIIGFYSVSSQYKFISDISKFIKSNYPEIFLISGGPHTTLNPDKVINDNFDAICIGEGERPMLELTNMLEKNKFPSNIKNLWIKKGTIIEKNKMAPFYENLDFLPPLDRKIWEEYIDYNPFFSDRNISILLGRGCPFRCTYCCNYALSKITEGKYVRFKSPKIIVEEIKSIHEEYPLENSIYLEIESFNANTAWAIELCDEIEKYNKSLDIPLCFGVNIRILADTNFDALFEACKRANILDLNIGLESGSERVRRDILERNYSNYNFENIMNSVKKYGLSYKFFVMIGVPGETNEDFRETVKICRIYQPEKIYLSIFYPYPGTELYKLCKKMNILQEKIDIKMEERRQVSLNLPSFNKRQIQRSYIWFEYNVYKGYRPRINLIKDIIRNYLSLNSFIYLILLKYVRLRIIKKNKLLYYRSNKLH